jgi:glycosyltransferase involved in cell wall biosynthesis
MKFSIVTPVYNLAPYLIDTIESVINQEGDFEIEYIIIDGLSNDGSTEIIKNYERLINSEKFIPKCKSVKIFWKSEKDKGMYDAINKGFNIASGDIYAWINGDDYYDTGAFQAVSSAFKSFPKISWVKGTNTAVDEYRNIIVNTPLKIYTRSLIKKGFYGYYSHLVIEQDSVFWRSALWKSIDSIPTSFKVAGDYWLWIQFSKYAELISIDQRLSYFRKRNGQQSQNINLYRQEQKSINKKYNIRCWLAKIFISTHSKLKQNRINKFLIVIYKILISPKEQYYIKFINGKPTIFLANFYILR